MLVFAVVPAAANVCVVRRSVTAIELDDARGVVVAAAFAGIAFVAAAAVAAAVVVFVVVAAAGIALVAAAAVPAVVVVLAAAAAGDFSLPQLQQPSPPVVEYRSHLAPFGVKDVANRGSC